MMDDVETIQVLTRNAIKCLQCNTVLESKHRHDFQCCGCENQTFVDGGRVYSRVGGKDFNLIEDLCEYKEYTKLEYESLQQERKEQQRISNEQGVADGKLVKLFGEYYDLKVINLLLSKDIMDKDLYEKALLKE
jgi:hypothetical protein